MGIHGYNHAEAHVGIAPFACGSHDQSRPMSICESVGLGQCSFQCSTLSVLPVRANTGPSCSSMSSRN